MTHPSTPIDSSPSAPPAGTTGLWQLAALFAGAALLAGCGSGGGGGGGGGGNPPPAIIEAPQIAAPPCTPSGPVANASVISGVATYEFVPSSVDTVRQTAKLNYAARADKPIRGATVTLINAAQQVIDSCVSDGTGAYALKAPNGSGAVRIRVRAELLKTSGTGGAWNFTVRDNTSGDGLYVLDSDEFTPNGNQTKNIAAGSGFDGTRYSGARAAGPFSILDVVFAARDKVLSASANLVFPPLKLFWSVNNKPANGNPNNGDIGTSFYIFSNVDGHTLFLLGQEDGDTDEYDTHVIAHEWGHYFQSAFSRDDSLGGNHGTGDKLDMRVAFSEGWGNGWSGIVFAQDPNGDFYTDSSGPGQASGFFLHVSQPAVGADRGWFSETTVQFLMFNFAQNASVGTGTSCPCAPNANVGFTPMFNVMSGSLKTSDARTSIHNFATLLKADAGVGSAGDTAINTLLTSQQISAQNDAFGAAETNNGGIAQSLPIYQTHNPAGGAVQYCASDAAGGPNKLGNRVLLRVALTGTHTLTLRSTVQGADPDFLITESDGTEVSAEAQSQPDPVNGSTTETLSVNFPAGTHTVELLDFNHISDNHVDGAICFTFNVQ